MGGLSMSDYISREAMSETPKCPGCGREMVLREDFHKFFFVCLDCGWKSPYGQNEKEGLDLALKRAVAKNHVLTPEELKAYCEGGADAAPLWYDSKDYSDVNRWMVIDLPKHAFGSAATVNCFVNGHFFEPTYGEEWRCWLRKPTEAERRETPWEN